MKNLKTLGVDLAKNVFQLHGTDTHGKCVLKKRIQRDTLTEFIANLQSCLIGVEACTASHHWARTFTELGHTVKIIAPSFVKPYVLSNKNDANDAAGIAEAVTRPNMRFVPIKTMEQQDALLAHRARDLLIKQRTALANQMRGLLAEYGIVISKGISHIKLIPTILDDAKNALTSQAIGIFKQLYEQFKNYNDQIDFFNKQISEQARNSEICKKIMKIEGIGEITATAIVATIGDAKAFKNGRSVAAWLGLVPKQSSSGNKIRLSGISKRGDGYVRKLLIQGARAVVNKCNDDTKVKRIKWLLDKIHRGGSNKAAVALANKNARIVWAIMAKGENYESALLTETA